MSGKRYVIPAAVALVLIVFAALTLPALANVGVGDKAPNFQLSSVSGQGSVQLSDYTSKPTILVFWASWCPHCQRELPVIQSIYKDLAPKGLNVVGVSVDRSIGDAKGFTSSHSITFPNAYAGTDKGGDMLDTYNISGIPTIYVLNKNGTVKTVYRGEISGDTLRAEAAQMGVK